MLRERELCAVQPGVRARAPRGVGLALLALGCGGAARQSIDASSPAPASEAARPEEDHRVSGRSSPLRCDLPNAEGSLQIYEVMTQIGTVAKREARDASGRIVSTVYYGTREGRIVGPFAERSLVLQSARLHEYDPEGREIRTVFCGSSLEVVEIMEVRLEPDGTELGRRWTSPEGRLLRETRGPTRLAYDDTGRALVGIHGPAPADVDLAQGWGAALDDLSFGLAASRTAGRPDQIGLSGTLRAGVREANVVSGFPFLVLRLDLRDASGRLVAQDRPRIERRVAELVQMNGGTAESLERIRPGEAETLDYTLLSDWYSGLAPGRYVLTATRRRAGTSFELASNQVELLVETAPPSR